MVAVLVRNDDAVQARDILADEREASHGLSGAETCVNKHARFIRRDQNRIAGRAAAQNGESHKKTGVSDE